MKTLFLLFSVLIARAQYVPVPFTHAAAAGNPALVQQTSTSTCSASSGTTITCTLPGNVTSGNDVVAQVQTNSALTVSSISGGGCTWPTAKSTQTNSTHDAETWWAHNCTGGSATITITLSGTLSLTSQGNVSEWSGLIGTSAVADAHNSGNSAVAVTATVTPNAGIKSLFISTARSTSTTTVGSAGGTGTGCTETALNTPNTASGFAYCIIANPNGTYTHNYTLGNNPWSVSGLVLQ